MQVRAPIAGTVIERKVTLGQAVERATDAFKIADTAHVWVTLDLYEKDLARVRVGQEVETRTDARPGEVFHGRVAFIVPVIDQATRTAKVRLEFPNPKGVLSAGPARHRPHRRRRQGEPDRRPGGAAQRGRAGGGEDGRLHPEGDGGSNAATSARAPRAVTRSRSVRG